jgi:DNA polymerase I-like protein with 3'-5' exonuclease and polymerase domains
MPDMNFFTLPERIDPVTETAVVVEEPPQASAPVPVPAPRPAPPNPPVFTRPIPIGFDTETFLITQGQLAPKIVCLSVAASDGGTELIGNDSLPTLGTAARDLIDSTSPLVGQNVCYDLLVLATNFLDLLPLIYQALDAERISCTMIREKLLCLTTTGDLKFSTNPDGSKRPLKFSMEALVKKYYGIDISADKTDSDSWRLNYKELDGIPAPKWPESARKYAIDDAVYAVGIWQFQEEARQRLISERGIDPFVTEFFRVAVDFSLKIMAAWGARTDPYAVAAVEKMLAEVLAPEKLSLLIESGILRPASPPRPHGSGVKIHSVQCDLDYAAIQGRKTAKRLCTCPPVMVAGEKEGIETKILREYIVALATRLNADAPADSQVMKLKFTEPSKKYPEGQLSYDAEWIAEFAGLDPVLEQYELRQEYQKLVTTELPRMKLNGVVAPIVHPQYDCIKASGRCSSYSMASDSYASFNCQNVDPRVRQCFIPREGYLLFSIDFSQMELGTLAQTCITLFGKSMMAEKINQGIDLHAFTGAQCAYAMIPSFAQTCIDAKAYTTDDIHRVLQEKKETDPAFYKHWRKFSKPVNFGYPGGMGAEKFVAFARKYDAEVRIDVQTAKVFKERWLLAYPELPHYFNHINTQCVDKWNKGWDADEKREYKKYCYDTPFGLHRAGCDYCSCSNGLGVQSPAAEGSLTANVQIVRACHDWTQQSILAPDSRGSVAKPIFFIHDEIVGEIRDDGADITHARLMAMRDIMIASMRIITPDVKVDAKPCLMRRWNKAAEPVLDVNGKLTIWEPDRAK